MEALNKLLFEAILLVLPSVVGGRSNAIFHNSGSYRPHAIVAKDSTSTMLGITFVAGPEQLRPGELVIVQFQALYHPEVDYQHLQEGVQFTVVEGRRIVAIGKIAQRWTTLEEARP